jgi:structural maintenance of chromosome 4
LEFLEDIIGSNKYVEKIVEIEVEVDKKNNEKIERINRVKAAEAELDSLK